METTEGNSNSIFFLWLVTACVTDWKKSYWHKSLQKTEKDNVLYSK